MHRRKLIRESLECNETNRQFDKGVRGIQKGNKLGEYITSMGW